MIGARGMVRFGQPPKRAILFRTETSFGKISTPVFTSPTQQRNRVEVLCDGQQIVVLGTHPGTGKPYSWHGGEPGDVARADLPELTEATANEFVAKAAAVMRAQGWTDSIQQHPVDEFDAVYGDGALPATAWQDLIRNGAGEGSRNDSIARLVGHLLRRRVEPMMTLELALAFNDARCRPPLPRSEVITIVDSICALELKRRLKE